MNPNTEYHLVTGHRYTFNDAAPRKFAEKAISGVVLNPFAGHVKLNTDCEVHRNDIDGDANAEYNLDAFDFVREYDDSSIGSIVHDPPWSAYQAKTKYGTVYPENDAKIKREYHRVLKDGGVVVQFGYSTTCMPGELEYERERVAVFQPYGYRNAFLGTIDRKQPRIA